MTEFYRYKNSWAYSKTIQLNTLFHVNTGALILADGEEKKEKKEEKNRRRRKEKKKKKKIEEEEEEEEEKKHTLEM